MKMLVAAVGMILGSLGLAHAEQSQKFGSYEVHYNAISTDSLLPDIARRYQITRSRNRGMLTVSVLRKDAGGIGQPRPAQVTANATTLTSQVKVINMREIREGDAVYYIGEFGLTPPETLRFTVNVKPQDYAEPVKVEFQQQLF